MSRLVRVIGVLLWHHGRIVQTEKFQITNVIHDNPIHAVEAIDSVDLDELIVLNISRDESTREAFRESIQSYSDKLRIPLAAGGLIRSRSDALQLLKSGADKLVINSIFRENQKVVSELVSYFGSSTIVASIDISTSFGFTTEERFVYQHEQQSTGSSRLQDVLELVTQLRVGEVFFNNLKHDGSRMGYDLKGIRQVVKNLNIPVIAFGGVSTWQHLVDALNLGVDAVAFGNALHYIEMAPKKAKLYLQSQGFLVRL